MKTNGIHHFSTHGDAKAALAKRFNRTLKETVPVLDSQEHAGILTGLKEYRAGIQRYRSSEHRHSSKRRNGRQRGTVYTINDC